MSLKKEAGKGLFWVAVERLGQQGLQAITFVILARLLTPEDFGLIGMIMIFFAVSQSFIDSGMGQALIREKEITNQDRSTVFWLNLILSCLFYVLLFVTAPAISRFYEQPELISLIRLMGLAVIFNGIAIVQRSEMTQQLEFKKQTYAQIPAIVIASIVAITMAYLNYGVWALAVQFVVVAFISSILLWTIQPARILFKWSYESFSRLFNFGYKLLISGLIATTYQHIYKLVIGKFFSAATLGLYTQAQRLQQLASQSLIGIIQKVTYPLLAKAGDDVERLKKGYLMVIQSSSFVIFPAMLGLILFAEPIMQYVLGSQWLPAAPFLQLLCASGIIYHLHSINLNVLKVLGRSDLFLKLEIIKKTNTTIAILIGFQFGIYGLLIGQVISSYIALFINTYYTSKFLNYTVTNQLLDVLKVLLLAAPMVVVSLFGLFLYPVGSLLQLLVYLFLSGFIYIMTSIFIRIAATRMIYSFISPMLPNSLKKVLHI